MSTVTEILYSDAAMAFTNSTGGTGGSWATNTNTAWSSGNAKSTTAAGDKVTITWTGRSLYLLGAQAGTSGDMTIVTDGVTRSVTPTSYGTQTTAYKTPFVIERGLTDGPHTTVISATNNGSASTIFINSAFAVTGSKTGSTTGVYSAVGDSWSAGTGTAVGSYPKFLARRLRNVLSRDIALTVRGVSGAGCAIKAGTNAVNGIQQLALANGDAPEFLSIGLGVNDLCTPPSTSAGITQFETAAQYADNLRTTLMFAEDVFDLSSVKAAVATPGFVSPAYRWATKQTTGTTSTVYNAGTDNYEAGVIAARAVILGFSWARLADVYLAMDRRMNLVYPNNAADLGLHPNEAGHAVVAEEFAAAYLG